MLLSRTSSGCACFLHSQHGPKVLGLNSSRSVTLSLSRSETAARVGFARSKAKAMDPEIARNQNYDDHYANDSEDVHSALLPFYDDSAGCARTPYVSAAIRVNSIIPS